jgi:RimJ/RimL family protein N-acetyltransferase
MEMADTDPMLTIFADPLVVASSGAPAFDRQRMQQWVQRNLEHQERYGYGLFAVILKSNGLLIGDCGLEEMEVEDGKVAELGYDFRSDYWHRGCATEAAVAVRDYAFKELNLPKIVSLIRIGNHRSRRVDERVGMTLIAEITRYGGIKYWKYGMERGNQL